MEVEANNPAGTPDWPTGAAHPQRVRRSGPKRLSSEVQEFLNLSIYNDDNIDWCNNDDDDDNDNKNNNKL